MNRYIKTATPIVLFLSIWAILFFSGRYMLYLQEQLQLFQNSWEYFIENCSYNSGFAQMVTEFIIQFCHIPWLGTLILAVVITGAIYLFRAILKLFGATSALATIMAIVPTIPLIYILIVSEGTFSFIQYTLALAATLPILKIKPQRRWIVTTVAAPLLFWLFGAPTIILPLFVLMLAIKENRNIKNVLINFIPVITYLLLGYIGIRAGIIGSFNWFLNYVSHKPLIQDLRYYEPLVVAGWYITPIIVATFVIFENKIWQTALNMLIVIGMVCAVHFSPNHRYSVGIYHDTFNKWTKLHYLYTQKDYNALLALYKDKEPESIVESNYINLSLIEQDRLLSDFFKYNPYSHLSLLMTWTDAPIPTAFIWSEVCRQVGFIYKSGQTAYEGEMLSGPRGSSMFTKLMAESEIVMGNYKVAQRYIEILENTIFYKEWATAQREFLSDNAVNKDPYYSSKRKCLYKSNEILRNTNELEMLLQIITKNPDHKKSFDFAAIMALSAGRLQAFGQVIDAGAFTGKIGAPYHPTIQQGLIMAYQNIPAFYKFYKIDNSLIEQYQEFQKIMQEEQEINLNQKAILHKNVNTLWYYLYTMTERSKRGQLAPQMSQETIPSN